MLTAPLAVCGGIADAETIDDASVLLVTLSIFLNTVGVSIMNILRDVRFRTEASLNTAATDMLVVRKLSPSLFCTILPPTLLLKTAPRKKLLLPRFGGCAIRNDVVTLGGDR